MDLIAARATEKVVITKQVWEEASQRGLQVLTGLCNALIEASFVHEPLAWGVLEGNVPVQNLVKEKVSHDLEARLSAVQSIIEDLTKQHEELKTECARVETLCDKLAWIPSASSLKAKSCSLFEIEEMLQEFSSQVGKDLQCKRAICQDVAEICADFDKKFTASTRDDLLLYLSVWSEQPYIAVEKLKEIESILLSQVG